MTIGQQVENILKASKRSRSDDKELFIIYMQKWGMALSDIQIETFRRMPSFETLRRVRQKIQQAGLYLADELTEKRRFEKYKNVKQQISFSDEVDKLIDGWSNK